MTDREGASPSGEASERRHEPVAAAPDEPDVAGRPAVAQPAHDAIAADDAKAADTGHAADAAVTEPVIADAPAEPTLRANPAVREFDVPFDTGQLERISTGQLLIVHRPGGDLVEAAEEQTQRRVFSWVSAVAGTIGAVASLFVGWMLPLSIAAIVFGVLGLRREAEGRSLSFVGIGTGLAGLVFSAVWIGYYAIVFGALPN